jgi:positive regulator of sigma E activity
MKKYIIIFTSAFLLELVMSFYIAGIAEKRMVQSVFFAFITPFMSLPFISYVIEAKSMKDRAIMACFSGSGYAVGVYVCMSFLR